MRHKQAYLAAVTVGAAVARAESALDFFGGSGSVFSAAAVAAAVAAFKSISRSCFLFFAPAALAVALFLRCGAGYSAVPTFVRGMSLESNQSFDPYLRVREKGTNECVSAIQLNSIRERALLF